MEQLVLRRGGGVHVSLVLFVESTDESVDNIN